jgi:hypothetical protein
VKGGSHITHFRFHPASTRNFSGKHIPLSSFGAARIISRQENICAPVPLIQIGLFQRRNVLPGLFFSPETGARSRCFIVHQKIAENSQNPPLICLTGHGAISISCGQGSGHPHPVVVDNVSGSFGNLVSPEAFRRR